MGERKEKKRKRGGCGSDQGLYETRVVCVWNRGTDQIGMGMQGKGRDETNYKRKEKKRKKVYSWLLRLISLCICRDSGSR